MDIPCKFTDKGCKEVGDRSFMRYHISQCQFGRTECPYWPCKELVTYGEVVDHLKNTHEANVITTSDMKLIRLGHKDFRLTFDLGDVELVDINKPV